MIYNKYILDFIGLYGIVLQKQITDFFFIFKIHQELIINNTVSYNIILLQVIVKRPYFAE